MTQKRPRRTDRRTFLRGLGRNAALAGLATLVLGLARRSTRLNGEHACIERGVCRRCRLYQGCRLPQSDLARRDTRRPAT